MAMSKRLRKQKAAKLHEEWKRKILESLNLDELRRERDFTRNFAKEGHPYFKEYLIKIEAEMAKRKK